MAQGGAGLPNLHLRALSAHLALEGFPHYAAVEVMNPARNSQISGVSSFGFGGSNARADFWGRSTNGMEQLLEKSDYVQISCPRCRGAMCWTCGVAIPRCAPREKHRCSAIREGTAEYDFCSECY